MSEIQVNFLGHACAEIICGKTRIITDPWLTGTAFLGGWQRMYQPPSDWRKRLQCADLIYVSHAHSDHLSPDTLIEAGDTYTVVPDFPQKSAERAAYRNHVDPFRAVKLGEWQTLGDCRFMILPDISPGHEDSGLIVEYKGKYLVNTVDCCMPNGLDLPRENVEWLLAPFAGGSSPYPVCYSPFYSDEKITAIMKRNNAALLKKLDNFVELTHPEKLMPFAGYYRETDTDIRKRNLHNKPTDVKADCEIVLPDLKLNTEDVKPEFFEYEPDFDSYFMSYDWKKRHMRFGDKSYGPHSAPATVIDFWNDDLVYYAIKNHLPIDELAIGYHLTLSRYPDVYEADFWEHFNFKVSECEPS